MTLEEFFNKLSEARSNFVWAIKDGLIRGKIINVGSTKCYGCCAEPFCPINAVARQMKSYSMPDRSVEYTCQDLGIVLHDANDIISSADNPAGVYRAKLLEILKLEENKFV